MDVPVADYSFHAGDIVRRIQVIGKRGFWSKVFNHSLLLSQAARILSKKKLGASRIMQYQSDLFEQNARRLYSFLFPKQSDCRLSRTIESAAQTLLRTYNKMIQIHVDLEFRRKRRSESGQHDQVSLISLS